MSYIFSSGGGGGGGGDVTAASNLTDNAVVIGDGGSKGVQTIASLGSAGEVLTSNGAGLAPSFQAISSGGISPFDATVGTSGADYTTISAAIAASKTRLLVIDDVTETADCAVPASGLYVYVQQGLNLDMADNQFTFAGNYNVTFELQDPSSTITWSYTAATNTRLFATGANTSSIVRITGGKLDNNSTQTGCYVQDTTSVADYENVIYEPPDVQTCGIDIGNAQSRINDLWITAPGTTATAVLVVEAGIARNIRYSGTFTNSNDATTVTDGLLDGVTNNGNLKIAVAGSGTLSNVNQAGGTLNIDCDGDAFSLDNVFVSTGTIAVNTGSDDGRFSNVYGAFSFGAGSDSHSLTGCTILGSFTMAGLKNVYSSCVFAGAVTVSGDQMGVTGSNFNSTLTVSSGADSNRFAENDYAGNVDITGDKNRLSGIFGTGITLTLNSGAEYNNIDVTIDQAPTDSSGNATNSLAYIVY